MIGWDPGPVDPSWDDFDWDPKTGIATFTREHAITGEPMLIARRPQPSNPQHEAWAQFGQMPQAVLTVK